MDKVAQERFEHSVSQPFQPAPSTGSSAEAAAQVRIAHALEYIAAQAGVVARKAVEIESHLATIAADYRSRQR
jgi:hypothetical protein